MPEINILFVDDQFPLRRAFLRTMQAEGYTLFSTDSALEAIEMAQLHDFAVVITDQMMPEMSGFELVEALREWLPCASFGLTSGLVDLNMAVAAVNEHGFDFVLPKPWEPEILRAQVERALRLHWERWTAHQMVSDMVRLNTTDTVDFDHACPAL